MTRLIIQLFVVSLFFLTKPTLAQLATEEQIDDLANDSQWLALIHYKKTLSSSWQSEIDDTGFFLSTNGQRNPKEELVASIHKLLTNSTEARSLQCQFPARYQWLSEQLYKVSPALTHCKDYLAWHQKLAVHSITLVFPAAYLDSPSSMFGHTLLRLDQHPEQDKSGTLSLSVSYAAAKSEEDSEIAFVYRGLVGGYPGDLAIIPYYNKIKEYGEIESRDIWEYKLNLTPEEIDLILKHLWEIKDKRLDYYFFTRNCSYRLLAILNVARPELNLTDGYALYTIPIATVRHLDNAGLIAGDNYRPSVMTNFRFKADQLSKNQATLARQLADPNSPLTQEDLAKIDAETADVAFQYSRLAKTGGDKQRKRSLDLLRLVNLRGKSTLSDAPKPAVSDHYGHESERLSVALGELRSRPYVELGLRPAYHDLTDPSLGFPDGAELIFSGGTARLYKDGELQLDRYTLIGIKSIKGIDRYFQPVSWSVGIGAHRNTRSSNNRLSPSLHGTMGYAFRPNTQLLVYSLAGGEAQIQKGLERGYDIFAQSETGLVYRDSTHKHQALLNFKLSSSVNNGGTALQIANSTFVRNISRDLSIKVNASWTKNITQEYSDINVALEHFF